jgi:CRISPR-associated protein Cmr3
LDVLFFRDGRPFMSGTEQMVSRLPLPQTFAGAIRTALLRAVGCDFHRLRQGIKAGQTFAQAVTQACHQEYHWIGQLSVRGPWLARRHSDTSQLEVLVPAPAILHRPKKGGHTPLLRLSPLPRDQLPGWCPADDQQRLRPLWLKRPEVTETVKGYLTPEGLQKFLDGQVVNEQEIVSPAELFSYDFRTGIGIAPDRLVAAESQIYSRGFLALKNDFYPYKQVVLYAELLVPEATSRESLQQLLDGLVTLPLGGEGRQVAVERLEQPFAWPQPSSQGNNHLPLLLLTTPGVFQAGWQPHALQGRLVAAAVPESLAFSGWDLARGGPKPTRLAVPAGSVYFLQDSLPSTHAGQCLAETDEERRQGWGCYLTGVWTDE